jgi:lipid-binding SYLF domain-containing protein
MGNMKAAAIAAIAATVLGITFSGATAKEESPQAVTTPKTAKKVASKPAIAPKVVKDEAFKTGNALKLIREISAIPRHKIPPELLKGASAIAIFPKASKNDFMISGASAGGVLLSHDRDGSWSNPLFVTLSGGTLGWQAVAEPLDIIMVIKNKKHVDAILKEKLFIDAKISTTSGRLGLSLKGATAKELKADITSYVRSRGAFVEDSTLGATTLQLDPAANEKFYAKPKIAPSEILSGRDLKSTDDTKALQKLLSDYGAK